MTEGWDPFSTYLARTYGGKKALGLAVWHSSRACLGALDRYKAVDWERVSRVIFVCKGNICRSAFAGRRFRAYGVGVASAGLEADPGRPADPRAAKVARRFGADLGDHRSAHVADLELAPGDLFVAFEPDHGDRLRQLALLQPGVQVTLLGLWSPVPGTVYLHDPYGLHESYFELCFERIVRGLEGMRTRLSMARAAMETMP
ncbi:MAG TPA: hypothetical protein VJ576_17180 [Rhodocyclaceae bacterium]|nr:hypothetical protein [Rhodocyclaceae bacterium]